jgi:hypothetical protein
MSANKADIKPFAVMLLVVIRRWSGLFNGNWVRCRKGVFKGFVERLLLLSPRALGDNAAISLTRFTFWIGIHFHLSAVRIVKTQGQKKTTYQQSQMGSLRYTHMAEVHFLSGKPLWG